VIDCPLTVSLEFPVFVATQQRWIAAIEICAGLLLALTVLHLLVGWVRHLSWHVRLTALLPLVAGIGAGIAAHSLQDTYTYWVTFLCDLPRSFPPAFQHYFLNGIANANHTATVIGWVAIVVTGLLLALSLAGIWRLVAPGQRKPLSASLARDS
jgi:hypothetical protein